MIRSSRRAHQDVRDGARAWTAGTLLSTLIVFAAGFTVFSAGVAAAADVMAPGSALWPPRAMSRPESIKPRTTGTTIEAEGLYSYSTPFAPPRWLRLQQSGSVLWGTIDINDSFGMCTRARLDGTVTDDVVTFTVPLVEADCPCSGAGAYLLFTGVVDANGGIVGTWNNNCSPFGGGWVACTPPDPPAPECPVPDNGPPGEIRLTPAGGAWVWGLMAIALMTLAIPVLRRGAKETVKARR